MKSLLKLQTLAEDVPAQLQQILVDLEAGKFRVNVHSAELERIAVNVRMLGLSTFIGLVACGLTIGGLLVFARDFAAWPFLPFLGGAALVVAGTLFGIGLVLYALGGPRRKIRLRRLLRHSDSTALRRSSAQARAATVPSRHSSKRAARAAPSTVVMRRGPAATMIGAPRARPSAAASIACAEPSKTSAASARESPARRNAAGRSATRRSASSIARAGRSPRSPSEPARRPRSGMRGAALPRRW